MSSAKVVFKNYTLPQLKGLLTDKGLSVEGKKDELLQRLSDYYKAQSLPESQTHPLPKDVRSRVSHHGYKDLSYFHERLKYSYTIGDKDSIQTNFLPDIVEFHGKILTEETWTQSHIVKEVDKSSKKLTEILNEFKNDQHDYDKIVFLKEHLKIEFSKQSNDIQIIAYLTKPDLTIPAYIMKLESMSTFPNPKNKVNIYKLTLTQQSNNQNKTSENMFDYEDMDKALPDLLLGILWVQVYFFNKQGKIDKKHIEVVIKHDHHRNLPRVRDVQSFLLKLKDIEVYESYYNYIIEKLKHKSYGF